MVDRNTFMETLHLVQEIARTSPEPMDRETALSYFRDMELSQEQEEMVYQFLLLPEEEREQEHTEAEDIDSAEAENVDASNADTAESGDTDTAKVGNVSAGNIGKPDCTQHFQMYLDEIGGIRELPDSAETALYQRLLSGDLSVIEEISQQWLKRVVDIAEEYKGRGALMDDLVQEGNMGLLLGLNVLAGGQAKTDSGKDILAADVMDLLKGAVRESMEAYIGEECGEDQQNETILAKVSLVHQAREYLTKEKGEAPSLRELSEYTRIPVEEISDIFALVTQKKQPE